jgi:hypothetical protein
MHFTGRDAIEGAVAGALSLTSLSAHTRRSRLTHAHPSQERVTRVVQRGP